MYYINYNERKEECVMKAETACLHASRDKSSSTGAVAVPIYQSATFAHPALGVSTGYDYSRMQNPTREHAEKIVAALEGGTDAMAFSSGMAAISLMMELFSPGDELLATDDLYGGSIRLFKYINGKNGVITRYVNTSDLDAVAAAITPATRAIFVETPTNPMMRVTDIAGIKRVIGGRGILLMVDNTFLTPYFMRPISLGADVVVHSGTKYLSGHNDTLAGFLVTATEELSAKYRYLYKTIGAALAPFDSFLVARGIKTLALRMEKSQANALRVAQWLTGHPKVVDVYYAGLESHPSYELSKRQASGFGAMISFTVDTVETARAVLEGVQLILFAESLGGVETLITYPVTQTHADVPDSDRQARGITNRLLRLSVGIEAAEDLIEDLARALG